MESCTDLVATGKTRTARRYHGRYDVLLFEIKHMRCGHVMWSSHYDAERLYRRIGATTCKT
jgi:hypothetical protein